MSKVLEKASKMVSAQAREMLCAIAGPRGWNDTRESWLAKASRRLGFGPRRTKAIFYGEARRISAEEWLRIESEFTALNESAARRLGAINELDLLARSSVEARREATRPMGVDCGSQVQAGPWEKRST